MRHLFIINPTAGKKDCTESVSAAAKILSERLGQPVEIRVSRARGDCANIAREAGKTGEETRIYACGGDGTLNEVVDGAAGYDNLAITSVPCGSGNDFIKQFPNSAAFFDLQNFGETEEKTVDLMDASGHRAINICSAGLDARIGTGIDAYRRHPLLSGSRAYTASIVVNLFKGIAKSCRVEFPDGTVIDEKLTLVCVCNGSWYGGGYQPVPEADMTDGILDVLVVKKVSRLTVARVISAYQNGRYREFPQLISHFQTDWVKITTPEVEPVNLDGELLRTNEVDIRLIPKGIRFFVPKAALRERGKV